MVAVTDWALVVLEVRSAKSGLEGAVVSRTMSALAASLAWKFPASSRRSRHTRLGPSAPVSTRVGRALKGSQLAVVNAVVQEPLPVTCASAICVASALGRPSCAKIAGVAVLVAEKEASPR